MASTVVEMRVRIEFAENRRAAEAKATFLMNFAGYEDYRLRKNADGEYAVLPLLEGDDREQARQLLSSMEGS